MSMKLWLLTGIKVQRKQMFLYRRQHFNLTNYTATVQSSQFNKNLGLQIKNLAGNSFPGRSTQWWLTNRMRCTSLALWDRAKWTCRISLHARGAHRFWCRWVRSMSSRQYVQQAALVGAWCQLESWDHCHGTDHHHGWWLTGPEF